MATAGAQGPRSQSTPQLPASADLAGYIASLEEPGRAEWQKPDEVIRALKLLPGETLCDVGSGPGYFALRAARLLEASGWVYAEDVEASMIDALRDRVSQARLSNVTPILGLPEDPLLPRAACDVILVVNTYHLFDRITLAHVGAFGSPTIKNTDGIALTQRALPGFPAGALFAVHDDGGVAAISWEAIAKATGVRSDCIVR